MLHKSLHRQSHESSLNCFNLLTIQQSRSGLLDSEGFMEILLFTSRHCVKSQKTRICLHRIGRIISLSANLKVNALIVYKMSLLPFTTSTFLLLPDFPTQLFSTIPLHLTELTTERRLLANLCHTNQNNSLQTTCVFITYFC